MLLGLVRVTYISRCEVVLHVSCNLIVRDFERVAVPNLARPFQVGNWRDKKYHLMAELVARIAYGNT
jgi:hypothetical protein